MNRLAILALLLALSACTPENNFLGTVSGSVAVTAGDFDDINATFQRRVIDTSQYEGLISTATWDDTYNPDNESLKVEGLLGTAQELDTHGAVFLSSGTRGLGLRQYNGLDPDDQFVADPDVLTQIDAFASRSQHALVATDWAYDAIEQTWPDEIEFLDDDTVFDAAQAGEIGTITATVENEDLAAALGEDQVLINFDFSNWAVMESAAGDATVWISAPQIEYRLRNGEGTQVLNDVPLLVTFRPGGTESGVVMYSAFHFDAQTPAVVDAILDTAIGEFDTGDHTVSPIQ